VKEKSQRATPAENTFPDSKKTGRGNMMKALSIPLHPRPRSAPAKKKGKLKLKTITLEEQTFK
jgi:hypothetical protein